VASIFPDITVATLALGVNTQPLSYGRELAFDFAVGEFIRENGKIKVLEGVEALKMWVEKAIRTPRYRVPIYSNSYGDEIEDLLSLDIPTAVFKSEVIRVTTEALMINPCIKRVDNFVLERGSDRLRINCRITSSFGDSFEQEIEGVS